MSGTVARSLGALGDAIGGTANVNFDAGTLFIDGVNNRVGVVSTSALGNSRLNVDLGITARTEAASGNVPYFQLFNGNAGTDLKTWRIGATSAGALAVETVNDAYSSATQRMLIDSSGRLRVPFQPAFYIHHIGASGINQQNVTVVLDTPLINRGSAYNTSNGRYTCPVAGLYQFFFGTIKSDAGVTPGPNVSRFRIRRNGSNISTELRLSENGGYGDSTSMVCLAECAANDFIDVFISDTGGWYGSTYAHFGGFLLG